MGNVKTLAKKITLDNAMLRYLDNSDNNATNPNENYAREFLELFTILKGPQISEGIIQIIQNMIFNKLLRYSQVSKKWMIGHYLILIQIFLLVITM